MRIEGQRGSDNVEDRRGMGPARIGGRGGLGIGTIVLVLAVSYFTGANPLTVFNMINGVQSVTETMSPSAPSESGPVGAPSDQLGRFASVVLADTETTWRMLLGPRYEDPRMVLFTGAVNPLAAQPLRPSVPSIAPTTTGYISILHFSTRWRIVWERLATSPRPM